MYHLQASHTQPILSFMFFLCHFIFWKSFLLILFTCPNFLLSTFCFSTIRLLQNGRLFSFLGLSLYPINSATLSSSPYPSKSALCKIWFSSPFTCKHSVIYCTNIRCILIDSSCHFIQFQFFHNYYLFFAYNAVQFHHCAKVSPWP